MPQISQAIAHRAKAVQRYIRGRQAFARNLRMIVVATPIIAKRQPQSVVGRRRAVGVCDMQPARQEKDDSARLMEDRDVSGTLQASTSTAITWTRSSPRTAAA